MEAIRRLGWLKNTRNLGCCYLKGRSWHFSIIIFHSYPTNLTGSHPAIALPLASILVVDTSTSHVGTGFLGMSQEQTGQILGPASIVLFFSAFVKRRVAPSQAYAMLGKQIIDFLRKPRLMPDLYCVAVFLPDYPTRKNRQSETMPCDL
jgi:hypothetical protein